MLDLYSRFVVAWMVAKHENSALAKQLFREAIQRDGVSPGTLTVHNDRGAPMTSHGFAELLTELGVDRSLSRPRVSNDNPMSESLFRTTKSQPDYPGRFSDVEHARDWSRDFFAWYNDDHHHDGLALFTPRQVYLAEVEDIARRRQDALNAAYQRHPERFVAGPPVVKRPPQRVFINPIDAAPPTAETALSADDNQLAQLWPTPDPHETPIINLPAAQLTASQQVNAT